jgi:DNA repair exonuclease SbcCD ATPase subunit
MSKINRVTALIAIVGLVLATGCAGREMTTTEKTAVTGALLGAGTGAIIGSATGRAGAGTAIGAGVGLLGGALMGQAIEAEAAKQRRLSEQERYRQQQLGTYGTTTTSQPITQEQESLALQREREKQQELERQIVELKERMARQEAQAGATSPSTSPPTSSTELSERIAKLSTTEKEARLEEVKRKVGDLREELELAKRIDNLALQTELEQQINELEEERAELERQLTFIR